MGCMEERGPGPVCEKCRFDNAAEPSSALYLRPRTELQGQYLVGRVLGHGGFGITYLGWDLNLERKVAIKEYLPGGVAVRASVGSEVAPASGDLRNDFEYGLERYLDEARTVARFQAHPAVVSVLNFFRANGTAYLVMEYLEGVTLERYLEVNGDKVAIDTVLTVMVPVMEALQTVHQQGILHRDVSPDNVYITNKWQVKVLDFGAARYALGQKSRNLSVILKEGYAPVEQYHSKGNQGPWTDVYACGATIYRSLTGQIPLGALDRLDNDKLLPPTQLGAVLTPAQEQSILKALSVRPEHRFHTMQAFRDALTGVGAPQTTEPKEELALPAFVDATFPKQPTGSPTRQPSERPIGDPNATRVISARPAPSLTAGHGFPTSTPGSPTTVASSQPPPGKSVPKWVWGAAGGVLFALLAFGAFKQVADSRAQAERDRYNDASKRQLQEELQKLKQLDQENEKRQKQRAELDAQLQLEEEELRLRQEELAKLQESQLKASAAPARTKAAPPPPPAKAAPPPAAVTATEQQQTPPPAAQDPAPAQAAATYSDILRQAQQATRARDYPLATQLSRQAMQLNPNRPEAYANLGWVLLYGSNDLEGARQNYQQALDYGGTIWFRVHHDHQNGSFRDKCLGDLGISRDIVQFLGQDPSHNFKAPRTTIKEARGNRSPFNSVSGDFHIKLNDNRNYNMVSVVQAKPLRDIIVDFLK
jgi:serine/threonine protein kinase